MGRGIGLDEYITGMQKSLKLHVEHLWRARRIEELAAGMGGNPELIRAIQKAEQVNKEYAACLEQIKNAHARIGPRAQTRQWTRDPRTMITKEGVFDAHGEMEGLFYKLHGLEEKYDDANAEIVDAIRTFKSGGLRVQREPEKSQIRELQRQIRRIARDFANHTGSKHRRVELYYT